MKKPGRPVPSRSVYTWVSPLLSFEITEMMKLSSPKIFLFVFFSDWQNEVRYVKNKELL
jgi:hypothetical protein